MAGLIDKLDAQLEELFNGWNVLSTVLAVILLALTVYPLISVVEPDTHPLLLNRQANVAPVRQPGESAVYRSQETPYESELKTGLNVKEPGTPKWHGGKDGDLRDIWRAAVRGAISDQGQPTGEFGKILSVYGREMVIEHDFATLSKQLNIIGQHIKQAGARSVAIFLPNSVELLMTIFAGAFYGFTPILIPHGQSAETAARLLRLTNADYLVAAAGQLPVNDVKQQGVKLRGAIWVVEPSSRDMDWKGNDATEVVWHELVEDAQNASAEIPATTESNSGPGLTTIWLDQSPQQGEIVTFTQNNIVAAVGAQLSALPLSQRLKPSDLFLPVDSLSSSYILIQTLAALYSNCSVALNSVAGPDAEIPLVATGIAPTIIAVSAESATNLHTATKSKVAGTAQKWALNQQLATLKTGVLTSKNLFSSILSPIAAHVGNVPGKLRLLYIFERTKAGTPPMTAIQLSELRAFTGARVIYALTTPRVAGAVAQTNIYDYRVPNPDETQIAHFGAPLSSVEIMVIDNAKHKTVDGKSAVGELVVRGPAVLDGHANLGVVATFRDDTTLSFLEE